MKSYIMAKALAIGHEFIISSFIDKNSCIRLMNPFIAPIIF
jgi:hypothetical protein